MAARFSRCIFQRTLTRRTTTPFSHQSKSFFRSYNSGNTKTSSTNTTKRLALPATCFLGIGLAGAAWYLRQRRQLGPELLAVKAAADQPCGDKNMAHRNQSKEKPKPKVSSPCKKRNKCVDPQPNVVSGLKKYSLFLWITLEPDADPCQVASSAAKIEEAIEATKGFDCDVDDEVLAGVGFGPNFLSQMCLSPAKNFCYRSRKGKRGEMPSSNGDIFVHAKADSMGQLFDFCKTYLHNFPDDSVSEFEDLYGFSYRGTRDISGFLINQTNRCKEDGLREVAVECKTGGSYALAQKWVHDLCALDEDPACLEKYIGRKMENREELPERAASAHVTRMCGSIEPGADPKYEIVQQSSSYGTLSERAGNFFLGFSNDPCVFDWMLDRMVGASCDDNEHDDVMRISKNVKGTYYYFPGMKQLEQMKGESS